MPVFCFFQGTCKTAKTVWCCGPIAFQLRKPMFTFGYEMLVTVYWIFFSP